MLTALVIGARRSKIGLGQAIVHRLEADGYLVECLDRETFHLDGLLEKIVAKNLIVVNLFDHRDPSLQLRITQAVLVAISKMADVHLVVVGSMAHYYSRESAYGNAKGELHDFVLGFGKNSLGYQCKVTLFEPGSVEHVIPSQKNISFTYLTIEETMDALFAAIRLNKRFMHISLRGSLVHDAEPVGTAS